MSKNLHILNRPGKEICVTVFCGHTCSGKGTQSKRHSDIHFSTGAEARRRCEDKAFATLYGPLMKTGLYLPHKVTMGLVRDFVAETDFVEGSYVALDGIPRDYDQAKEFDSFVACPNRVLGFDIGITLEEALNRAARRAEIENRTEDFNPKIVSDRWHIWAQKRQRTLAAMKSLGVKIYEIDGMRPVEDVSGDISGRITTFFRRQKEADMSTGGKTKKKTFIMSRPRHQH